MSTGCAARASTAPDDWLDDDRYRNQWKLQHPSDEFRKDWRSFQAQHADTSLAAIETDLELAAPV